MEENTEETFKFVDCIGIFLAVPSIFGLIGVIFRILYRRSKYSSDLFLILIFLLLSVMITDISYFLYLISIDGIPLCPYQGFLNVFSHTSILIWNILLVFRTYHFLSFRCKMTRFQWFMNFLLGYAIPFIIAIMGINFNLYETNQVLWCWIESRIIEGVLFLFHLTIFIINLTILLSAKKFYHENIYELEDLKKFKKYYILFRFSWIPIIIYMFGGIYRILFIFDFRINQLEKFIFLLNNAQGIFFFIVFHFSYAKISHDDDEFLNE